MLDLKRKNECASGPTADYKPPKFNYPSMYIELDDGVIPLDDGDVGKEVTATVRLKITRITRRTSSNEKEQGKKNEEAAFDVLGIEFGKVGEQGRASPLAERLFKRRARG